MSEPGVVHGVSVPEWSQHPPNCPPVSHLPSHLDHWPKGDSGITDLAGAVEKALEELVGDVLECFRIE